ncbi:MAG: hypothetical protein JXA66_05225 [Oligoflexia bacterium]|nr:hypothetical protein [Oligoflexia bacterium]
MKTNQNPYGFLHSGIEKPVRYLGKEFNSVIKDNVLCRMLLAFPDTYEIGMSHFGSRILYGIVNNHPDYALERAYMPWIDVKTLLSMETARTMREFDIVGFSMQHELACTNILAMLDMGGLEIFPHKRNDPLPLVIAGGGAAFNPHTMAEFIDAFVIGDAEPVILDILQITASTKSRKERLVELSKLEGVFVPSVHGKADIVKKSTIRSLDDVPVISDPVVPYLEAVHNRLTYEVQRGCNR